jgi:hypothetical protein
VRYRPLSEEVAPDSSRLHVLREALAAEDSSANAGLYVLLRAADRFHRTSKRFPGAFPSVLEEDVPALKAAAGHLLAECGIGGAAISDDLVGARPPGGGGLGTDCGSAFSLLACPAPDNWGSRVDSPRMGLQEDVNCGWDVAVLSAGRKYMVWGRWKGTSDARERLLGFT